jgi:hypothetical protein
MSAGVELGADFASAEAPEGDCAVIDGDEPPQPDNKNNTKQHQSRTLCMTASVQRENESARGLLHRVTLFS